MISTQNPDNFFGISLPTVESLTDIDPHLISGDLDAKGLSDETYRILMDLDLASRGEAVAMDDFIKGVLRLSGYEARDYLLRSRYDIPFWICDVDRFAETDVCLIQGVSAILLVIKMEKCYEAYDVSSQEARVVAGAIAAFQYNNNLRRNFGKPTLDSMTIPCITMVWTRPTFYKVPVTRELSDAVLTGQFPGSPTIVERCVIVPENGVWGEGMECPNFRRVALRYFIAFHTLAKSCWEPFVLEYQSIGEEETEPEAVSIVEQNKRGLQTRFPDRTGGDSGEEIALCSIVRSPTCVMDGNLYKTD